MRIFVMAHGLRAGGGKVVGSNLLQALSRINRNHKFHFLVPETGEYKALADDQRTVSYYRRFLGDVGRFFYDLFVLRGAVKNFSPDFLLGLGNFGLTKPPCPQALMIHNSYLFYDYGKVRKFDLLTWIKVKFQKLYLRSQLPRTHLVFCQTETIQNRLRDRFDYCGETVITPNVAPEFTKFDSFNRKTPQLLKHCDDKFKLFYLTRYYPHKGIESLVEMMDEYRDELSDFVLIITVEEGQHKNAKRLLEKINQANLEDRILNAGYLEQSQLPSFYESCDALIMPTRLESFSVTYLEAMYFGLPILTSDLDFAKEICGDAAVYFNPWSVESIKDVVLEVKNNPSLRAELMERGKKRLSKRFNVTWDDIAEKMLAAIEIYASNA